MPAAAGVIIGVGVGVGNVTPSCGHRRVDLRNPPHPVPAAAGVIIGVGVGVGNVTPSCGHRRVDLRNPPHPVPAAAGVIIGVGDVTPEFTDTFSLSGIALGTVVVITGYHALRAFAPARLKAGRPLPDEGTSGYDEASS